MSNIPRGTFMQVMEKYTKSLKAFISAQGFGHYSKPNGGIPKTDLDQSVQTSLGKADSALQSFTESDPTVPAWAKAASKPSYTASEVGLGNVGNFKAVSTVASQGLSDTEKSNARTNIGAGTSNLTIGNTGTQAAAGDHSHNYSEINNTPTLGTAAAKNTESSSLSSSDDVIPTSRLVKTYVDTTASGVSRYINTISSLANLSNSAKKGDYYIVSTGWAAGTNTPAVHAKDYIIAQKDNPSAMIDDVNWSVAHNEEDTDTTYSFYAASGNSGNNGDIAVQPLGGNKTNIGAHNTLTGKSTKKIYAIKHDTTGHISESTEATAADLALSSTYDKASTAELPAANDPVQTAIGKLAKSVDTNKTNILLLQHQQNIFAYHVNPNESDPYEAVTYLENAKGMIPAKMTGGGFSYGSWGSAFFLPKPCVLKFDGTVDYYLNPYDYSKKIDGSAAIIDSSNTTGNVMLEFPKIWVKRVPGATAGERTVYIADSKVDNDYKCFSNINSSNEEKDHFYIHAYNGTIHNSQMRSLSGVTLNSTYAPNYTARQEILAAKANNPSGSAVMWFTDVWSDMQLLFDLLYLMGKSLDVQRTFGQGLSSGGETAMRAYVTGTHNDKGLFYGDTIGTSTAVKVLGIENLWACRWNRIAGLINVAGNLKVKMTYGTADGSTATEYETPLDSTNATANLTGAGYLDYGTILKSNGYVSQIQADNSKGYKITSRSSGANNKYYCDYYYQSSAANTKYYALLGGYSGYGAHCGFSVDLSYGAANTVWFLGGALSFKP